MKMIFAFFLALVFAIGANAGPYDLRIEQRNNTDMAWINRIIPSPATDGLFFYNPSTLLMSWVTLGSGLSITGGVLSSTVTPGTQADWNSNSGPSQILNRPTLAAVATSGAYGDLSGRPSLSAVALSGAYADLTGRPTLSTVATTGAYADLTGIPSTFAPSAHTHAAADIVSGTLADARIPSLAISKTTGLQTALDGKFAVPTGTTAQYLRGDGTTATFPTNLSAFTNGPGYITGISSAQVTAALGFTPYDAANPSGFITSSALSPYLTTATAASTYATQSALTTGLAGKANTATTLAGYGITDAYPLSGNPSGFLTTVSSAQVTSALGFTPVSQAGARSAISLTTTGTSGPATYNSTTGVLNVPNYANSGGTVTSITAGTGLSGGTITTTGTISLPNTGTAGTYNTVTTDAQGRVTGGTPRTINDAPGRSLVTTTTSTGYQISATRDARVCYEGSFSTTSTIGGPASASVFLETADTNSTTAGDWTTKARQTYTNTITLAVVLNQVQANNWAMCRDIPAGKYVRLRSGSISGTASVSLNTEQQETLQ